MMIGVKENVEFEKKILLPFLASIYFNIIFLKLSRLEKVKM